MDQSEILGILERELKSKLQGHLKKIILFGSRARGDHDPDSDYDVLVMLDDVSPAIKGMIYEIGGNVLYDHDVVLSLFPIIEPAVPENRYDPFLAKALEEGIIHYEAA